MPELKEKTKIVKVLRGKATEFLEDRKNANNVVDILQHFESGRNTTSCLLTIELIFTKLLERREFDSQTDPKYKEWLTEAYNQVWSKTLHFLENGKNVEIKKQALTTAMKLIAWEGKYPVSSETFPTDKFKEVLSRLLSSKILNVNLISNLQEYTAYADVLFMTWKLLPNFISKGGPTPNDVFVSNFLEVINKAPLQTKKEETPANMCGLEGKSGIKFDFTAIKKSINRICFTILKWDLNLANHKMVLILLLERFLPHLDKPILLTDFLMDSLDCGGAVSVLALQGIYHMIRDHNLDYPQFFEKLYQMFEPEIFHTKYKSRLFYLADMFLQSTHLPLALVGAFAKRLSRLTLIAPSEDSLIILKFVGNLLIRHPQLKRLISTPDKTVDADPFIMDECNPYKSNALESSLWELKVLQSHSLPNICIASKFIDLQSDQQTENDLSQVLDVTGDEMFDKEIKRRAGENVFTFNKPLSLASNNEVVLQFWNLT